MAPQNIAEMLDNSNLDATWEKFVKYLIRFKFLAVGKVENLSLPQLKTIYNLNFKHNEVTILTLFLLTLKLWNFWNIFHVKSKCVMAVWFVKLQFDEFYVM